MSGRMIILRKPPFHALITPEETSSEAVRRIQQAEKTKATRLDLSELPFLTRVPPELERLGLLQGLNLSGCKRLRELTLTAGLVALRTL
jgi:hypothetical protein